MISPPRSRAAVCCPELTYKAAVDAFGAHGAAELCYLVGLYCLFSVTPEWLRCSGAQSPEAAV